jgi:hypothetical protein
MALRQVTGVCGWVAAVILVGLCVGDTPAWAQTSVQRGYVVARGGLSIERSEDNLRGEAPGAGVAVGFGPQRAWSPEVEFWYPGWIRSNASDGRHRDILGVFAMRRAFGVGRVRPYVLLGGSVARTETQFTTCTGLSRAPDASAGMLAVISCADPDVLSATRERQRSLSIFGLGGGGAEIGVSRRLRLLAEVRVDFAVTAVIVRPSIGVAVRF